MNRRQAILATLAAGILLLAGGGRATAAEPIRIGDLFSYARIAAFADPYRNGWQLALEEINGAGGIDGRPLEVISRDDGGTTADAVRVAEELVTREQVSLLFGTYFSNVGLAVADFARQRQVLFVAAEPLTDALTMDKGNRYTFRIRPNTYMQTAMLVDAAADLGVTRWAIVAPNYEYGQAAAANFKQLLAEKMPGAEVVAEQYPALGKVDAGATVQALLQANPDGIFNVLFAGDLAKFVREGQVRGLFENRNVLSLLTGEPEYLVPLKGEAPQDWLVTGYPWDAIDLPAHKAFVAAYEAKYGEPPRLASLLGYTTLQMIGAMLEKAGSTETDAMIAALEDLEIDSPIGPVTMRGLDHQSSMGAFVGRIAVEDGQGRMVDWHYADGKAYLFPEEAVRKARGE